MNLIFNLIIIAIAVLVGFWVLGLLAAALALPAIIWTLLKVLLVIVAVVWLINAFRGGRYTIIR
jgi:hypothetical protein